MKKIYFVSLIIFCLLFGVKGFLLYINYGVKPSEKIQRQIIYSDTNQWTEYINLNLHYSIKYPNQWEIVQLDEDCLPNDNSPCGDDVLLRATSTTPIQIVVFYNKKELDLLDWVSDRGHATKECQKIIVNNLLGLKCKLSYYFQKGIYTYSVSGINPDYFIADYRNNQEQEFIDEMKKVISINELPANFYSTKMTNEQLLLLEEKIVAKIVSTFRIGSK